MASDRNSKDVTALTIMPQDVTPHHHTDVSVSSNLVYQAGYFDESTTITITPQDVSTDSHIPSSVNLSVYSQDKETSLVSSQEVTGGDSVGYREDCDNTPDSRLIYTPPDDKPISSVPDTQVEDSNDPSLQDATTQPVLQDVM